MSSICKIGYLNQYYLNKMKNSVTVREYRHSDYEELINIWDILEMGRIDRKDTKEIIHNTLQNNAKMFLLEKEGKIIGTSWITSDYRRLFLHHFCILPEHQGKGYANILLKKTLEYAEQQNMQIKLEVHKDNIRAVKLYEKFGFRYIFKDYIVMILKEVMLDN